MCEWEKRQAPKELSDHGVLFGAAPAFSLQVLLTGLTCTWQGVAHAHRHVRTSAHTRRPPKRCPRPSGVRTCSQTVHTHVPHQVHSCVCL